jgi:uncharacterized protein (TIGR00725 family)
MSPVPVELPKKTNDNEKIEIPQTLTNRLIKNVTFFGDSAIPEGDAIYTSVWESAKFLAQKGYTIVNGGGPGIMKAATDGAESVGGNTIAIYWQPKLASFFEGKNLANVTDESETASNYIIRTLGLIEEGDAYVVCKGGTGTISEFGMVWCLAKLYFGVNKPVILFGDFWDKIIEAFQKYMYIDEMELSVLYQATTKEEILKILEEHERKIKHTVKGLNGKYGSDEQGFVLGGDSEEIKKTYRAYNEIASTYHSSHAGKLVAQKQLDEFFDLVHSPAQVLDIGSGPGHDAGFLSTKYSVTGVELSKRFFQIAKFENPNVNFVNANIIEYDLEKNKYKGIWARDAIHHVPERKLDALFKKIADSLVEGGILYLLVREGVGEITEKERTPYTTTEKFFHLFTEEELADRAKKAGLKVEKIEHTQRSHKWLVGVFKK